MIKILKFGTSHCPQCKVQDRELMKITGVPIERIDAEEEEETTDKYKVSSVPTTLIVDDDKVLMQFTGIVKSEELQAAINSFIKGSNETDRA